MHSCRNSDCTNAIFRVKHLDFHFATLKSAIRVYLLMTMHYKYFIRILMAKLSILFFSLIHVFNSIRIIFFQERSFKCGYIISLPVLTTITLKIFSTSLVPLQYHLSEILHVIIFSYTERTVLLK